MDFNSSWATASSTIWYSADWWSNNSIRPSLLKYFEWRQDEEDLMCCASPAAAAGWWQHQIEGMHNLLSQPILQTDHWPKCIRECKRLSYVTNHYSSCLRAVTLGTVPSAVTACAVLLAASASKSLTNTASTNGRGDVSFVVDCQSRC